MLGPALSTAAVLLGIEIHTQASGATPEQYMNSSLVIVNALKGHFEKSLGQECLMFACFNSDVDSSISNNVIPMLVATKIPFFFSSSADISICTLEYPNLDDEDVLVHVSYDYVTDFISWTDFGRQLFALPASSVLEAAAVHKALLRTRSSSVVARRKIVSDMLLDHSRGFDLLGYLSNHNTRRVQKTPEYPHFPLFTPAAVAVKHKSKACRLWWPLNGSEVLQFSSAANVEHMGASTTIASCDFEDDIKGEILSLAITFKNADRSVYISGNMTTENYKGKDQSIMLSSILPVMSTDYTISIAIDSDKRGNIGSFLVHQKLVRFEDMPPIQPVMIHPMLVQHFRERSQLGLVLNAMGLVGTYVEVGVHKGEFAREVLTHWLGKRYIAVDPYEEGFVEDYLDGVNSPDKDRIRDMRFFFGNTAGDAYRTTLLRMKSVEGSKHFVDNTIDAVYIDAMHNYHMIMQDMQAWWPKLKSGGILSGHDFVLDIAWGLFTVKPAVLEFGRRLNVPILDTGELSWYIVKP